MLDNYLLISYAGCGFSNFCVGFAYNSQIEVLGEIYPLCSSLKLEDDLM